MTLHLAMALVFLVYNSITKKASYNQGTIHFKQ